LAAQLRFLGWAHPPRPARARPRRERTDALALLEVAGHGAGADAKPLSHGRFGLAGINRIDDALAQIQAIRAH
jgi:hypothetical protein